ncbi:uncharacterized protein CIMG_09038 [Coccidioides immitis RS]|uniref:Uncharacterized protein n=3 Tax=Coccidioides immitis TaxID=5501 RepID=J3K1H9_COCIM|nr:uncharacterized protein CIMG_09038 [Coccidioides immitis RS]EAS27834.3 hypothetical protein CIMG_09038 [Coccidioides immitis RS]KMU78621.1 hypothetical protein CISG_01661 [Coccidioides immitis RMSCC 3703]KMU87437.1 hypothetical protein CIHG_05232 [Coccidioides immitis H538.4]
MNFEGKRFSSLIPSVSPRSRNWPHEDTRNETRTLNQLLSTRSARTHFAGVAFGMQGYPPIPDIRWQHRCLKTISLIGQSYSEWSLGLDLVRRNGVISRRLKGMTESETLIPEPKSQGGKSGMFLHAL